jgi:hypothetical protein
MTQSSQVHDAQPYSLERTFREYFSIYNGDIRESFTPSEEQIIDCLFATNVSVTTGKSVDVFRISQLKRQFLQEFLQAGRICKLLHFEFLNDQYFEYKINITDPKNGTESAQHVIATIDKNTNKIVSMEPFSNNRVAKIRFETKFREYFALYDGVPKVFGEEEESIFQNLFSEDFRTTIRRHKYDQEEWMETVKTCIEGGMKVDIVKFSFARHSAVTFEYKLQVANKAGEVVVLHSLGTTTNGKFASFTAYNERAYQSVLPDIFVDAKKDGKKKKKKSTSSSKSHRDSSGLRGLWVIPTGWERKGYLV